MRNNRSIKNALRRTLMRARDQSVWMRDDHDELCPFHCRCQEAADEVERLRDALADMYWQAQHAPLHHFAQQDERENARKLLGIPKTS
jgi:uncharacterized sporulation protein YeaH/YhbH (DUF444 family)